MPHLGQALWALFGALWVYARGWLRIWTAKDSADAVRKLPVGSAGVHLYTFRYQGQPYCGHVEAGRQPHARPWYRQARRRLKQPLRAYGADGTDVTHTVQRFWGPLGDWNTQIGLCFLPEEAGVKRPVFVLFNDKTVQTL